MPTRSLKALVASFLVASLVAPFAPARAAAPLPATLTGTVLAGDGPKPLAGATVVLTDAAGHDSTSAPTKADGAFLVQDVAPGRCTLALVSAGERYPIATPLTLAPGQTRGLQLALKGRKKKGGAVAASSGGGAIGAMIAVIVGFVAAGAVAADKANNDNKPASPSTPAD